MTKEIDVSFSILSVSAVERKRASSENARGAINGGKRGGENL